MQPNIVILGVGHSNTTITTRQLEILGWNLGDADEQYAESVSVRNLNDKALQTGKFDENTARKILASIPQPWAIKDPRFSWGALSYWANVFKDYEPILLWITKDMEKVKQSYIRRNESPAMIYKWYDNCVQYFKSWPYMKMKIDASQVEKAVQIFKINN